MEIGSGIHWITQQRFILAEDHWGGHKSRRSPGWWWLIPQGTAPEVTEATGRGCGNCHQRQWQHPHTPPALISGCPCPWHQLCLLVMERWHCRIQTQGWARKGHRGLCPAWGLPSLGKKLRGFQGIVQWGSKGAGSTQQLWDTGVEWGLKGLIRVRIGVLEGLMG